MHHKIGCVSIMPQVFSHSSAGFCGGCSKERTMTRLPRIQSKVAADPVTKDSAVTVTAKDGKVTLEAR